MKVDLREQENMTCNEQLNAILAAWPQHGVVIFRDGDAFRAALVDRLAGHPEPASECRVYPDEAVDRLHQKLVAQAATSHQKTGEHLSKLMTRISEKPSRALPTDGESRG